MSNKPSRTHVDLYREEMDRRLVNLNKKIKRLLSKSGDAFSDVVNDIKMKEREVRDLVIERKEDATDNWEAFKSEINRKVEQLEKKVEELLNSAR